jgi:6-phosphogluconolactonase
MTFPTLNAAESAVFLVTGSAKGPALRGVVEGSVPAARVRPHDGDLLWFLDDDAARAMRAAS